MSTSQEDDPGSSSRSVKCFSPRNETCLFLKYFAYRRPNSARDQTAIFDPPPKPSDDHKREMSSDSDSKKMMELVKSILSKLDWIQKSSANFGRKLPSEDGRSVDITRTFALFLKFD